MKHFAKLVLGALLACAVIAAPLRAEAQTLAWDPSYMSLGQVPIGGTGYGTLTLTNTDGVDPLTVSNIEFSYNQNDEWTFTTSQPLAAVLLPGESMQVTLAYSPIMMSFGMADIVVTNDSTNAPALYYSAMGYGMEGDACAPLATCGGACVDTQTDLAHCGGCWMPCDAPANGSAVCEAGSCGFVCDEGYEAIGDECVLIVVENDPLAMIGAIIEFFEQSRADGTLVGLGPGASGEHRADALGNMLEDAEELIAAEEWDEACGQIRSAYLRTDSSFPPPDFVDGENTYALAEMLFNLGVEMECPVPQVNCSAAPGAPGAPTLLVFGLLGLALARLRRR